MNDNLLLYCNATDMLHKEYNNKKKFAKKKYCYFVY